MTSRLEPHYDPEEEPYDREESKTVVFGEDPEEIDSVEDGGKGKPVRILTDFVIFDPAHDDELVSLEDLFDTTISRQFEAIGNVAPEFNNEEDAGLDDDGSADATNKQRLRTTAIFGFTLDYNSSE